MGRIVAYIAVSIDGYIARSDGSIDWLQPFEAVEYGYAAFLRGIETVVMGRITYEQCLSFASGWPYPDHDTFIVTSQHLATLPSRARIWNEPVPMLMTRLRAATGDAWIVGGSKLLHAVTDADGIDRFEIFVIPVLLGDGIPLFPRSDHCRSLRSLRLRRVRELPMGMVHLVYDVTAPP